MNTSESSTTNSDNEDEDNEARENLQPAATFLIAG